MTQPSFEYLEDKKELRQVPPPEPKPSSEYPDAMRSSDDWARWHDDHLKWVEVCASLPTYPVMAPNEQWEREVRGRKDLKEGVEFKIQRRCTVHSGNGFFAIPILPVQEEVKGGEEGDERRCTLTDAELMEKCRGWISSLCKTGARSWVLTIPVNFNKDPDMLFSELIRRYKALLKSDPGPTP